MTEEEKIKEEIAFTDYWFTELGKTTTPTFADAIEWAEKRQRKTDIKESYDWIREHWTNYSSNVGYSPLHIMASNYKKAMED